MKVRVGDAKTSNDMWKKDPRQKLIYTGAIKWARAHTPELILGVMTDDDIDRMRDMGELRPSGDGTYAAGGPPPRPVRSYGTEPTRQALPQQVVDHEEPEIIDQEIDGDATEADTPGPRFWLHDEEGGQMTEYPGADWPGAFARYIDENEVPADVGLAFAKANEAVLREVEKAGFDCSGVRACIEAMEKYQRAQEARRQKAEQEQGQTAGGAGAAQEQEQTANAPATAQADGQPPADAKEGETAAQQPAQAQQQPIPAEGREIRDAAGNIVDRSGRVIEWLGKVQKLVIAAPDGAAKAKIVENNRAIGEHLVKAYPSKAAGPWQTIEADAGVGS